MFDIASMIFQIRAVTNQRVDNAEQGFFTDLEITKIMQKGWNSLYYEMVTARKGYFVKSIDFNVGSGNFYTLPDDHFRIYKLQKKLGDKNFVQVDEVDIIDEEWYENRLAIDTYWYSQSEDSRPDRAFVILNNTLVLMPPNSAQGAYRLRYVPVVPEIESALINPPATIIDPNDENAMIANPLKQGFYFRVPAGFEEWIQWETAIRIGIPEEGELKNMKEERAIIWNRITEWMSDRTNNKPKSIKRTVDFYGNRYQNLSRGWPRGF